MRKFRLLEKFEKFVAGRIQQHKYLGIDKTQSTTAIKVSDVSQLELEPSFSFRSDDFDEYLRHDGIYSVSIADLQAFLAENALKMGVHIFGNVKPRIISRLDKGRVSKIEVAPVGILRPNLFFIAEGVHSETAALLGMRERELESACSGEKWVFGSMHYSGQETFVISVVDASKETLRLANVIFNSVSRKMNVAVTVQEEMGEDGVRKEIQRLVQTVFDQKTFPIHQEDIGIELLAIVEKAVHIVNRVLISPSRGNIYALGDLVGSSSPLAGAGGSIGLTFVPLIVSKLLKDYEEESADVHENFDRASRAYARRWIEKSHAIKTVCMDIADTMNRA